MLIKTVDKSKFVIISIILLAILVMIRAYEDSKFYDNKITIRGITFSYEKLPTKQNEAVKFRIYNDNELPTDAMVKFQIVDIGMSFGNLYSNDVGASADAFDLKSGTIVESEMPKEATNVKGKYRVVVYGYLTDPDDPDDPDLEYRFSKIIDEFEIK